MSPTRQRTASTPSPYAAAIALLAAVLLLTGRQAHASTPAGRGPSVVRVVVELPAALSGAVAIVNLSPVDAPEDYRTIALSSGRVVATFDGVEAGLYQIAVNVPGGLTAEGRFRLDAHEIVTLTATIAPGGPSRLTATGRHQIGDTLVVDARFLRDLPSTSHLSALVETVAPFVVVDQMDNGGLATARTAFMAGRGASLTATVVAIGEMTLPDVGRAALTPMTPDLAAFGSVAITHGSAPVDVSTSGTHMTLMPRSPGATFTGEARASFTTSGMVATNEIDGAPSIARLDAWRQAGVVVGGPIGSSAGALVAASVTRTRQRQRSDPRTFAANAATLAGHAVLRPGIADQLRMIAGGGRWSRPFDGRVQFDDDDVQEDVNAWHAQVRWERAALGGASIGVSAGVQRQTFSPRIASPAGGVVDRVFDGVVPDPPAAVRAADWTVRVDGRPAALRLGAVDHGLRLGATLRRGTAALTLVAQPEVAETVAGLPARLWAPVATARDARRAATHATGFVEDHVALTPTLSVVAGARVSFASGSAAGAASDVRWTTVSPRAQARWRIGSLTAFGGVARYAADLELFLLAYGDPAAHAWNVHRWIDPNRNGRFDAGEAGVLLARAGPAAPVASIDPDLDPPRTTEWTAGAEWPVGASHRLRGSIVIRRERSLIGIVNAGVPRSSYDELLVPDQNADWHSPSDDHLLGIFNRRPESFGSDALVLTNPEDAVTEHDGIELEWHFRSARWQVIFGAMAYRSIGRGANAGFGVLENDQGLVGEQYATPNAAVADPGRLFFDRAYVGKWAVGYHAPRDLRMAVVARYQDGQPFSRVLIADLSTGPEMIQAYAPGRTRFTYTGTIDARVEKGFRLGNRRAAVQLDVFNLTNHRNEVEEDALTRETFRRSTAVQPPLTARLGFRIEF